VDRRLSYVTGSARLGGAPGIRGPLVDATVSLVLFDDTVSSVAAAAKVVLGGGVIDIEPRRTGLVIAYRTISNVIAHGAISDVVAHAAIPDIFVS
jgi:hypothetical protein